MVFRWRRAQHEHDSERNDNGTGGDLSPNLSCRATGTTVPAKSASVPVTPKLQCKTSNNTTLFAWSSTPSSPRSPSPSSFSILKSNLRISRNRCGLCLKRVKLGPGVAIFTAECSHCFHFPCIASHLKKMKKKGGLACPVCSATWKETPLLPVNHQNQEKLSTTPMDEVVEQKKSELKNQKSFLPDLKVYNDDERLTSLTPRSRFNPIPESDESCDEDSIGEFLGFHVDKCSNSEVEIHERDVDVRLLPEAAVISAGRSYETYAIVLRAKAPAKTQTRAPIDLVTVVDVSRNMSNHKLQMMKRTMRTIISSLSSSDRLSIIAFSSYSKRILHLKRMTNTGKITASHIVEAMAVVDGFPNATDAVRKAVKVLEDRRDKNTVASIILLSDVPNQSSYVSSTRYLNVAVHTLKLTAIDNQALAKTVGSLLNVTVQDMKLSLGFVSGSSPAEITAVYLHAPPSVAFGTSTVLIGELCANEERELLIEMKVPSSAVRVHRVLSVRCSYRESVSQDIIHCNERALVVPHLHTVRSSSPTIQRLRNLFITTRALAEARQLAARNDLIGAYRMLISARAIMNRTGSDSREFVVSLEAELDALQWGMAACMDEKGEPLTPTSAWRVAEKLAKIRKSLNRVRDLHGFEEARF